MAGQEKMETASTLHTKWPREPEDRNKTGRRTPLSGCLPESSLDKYDNKWGNTKAGILEGAILVLDGMPMETKVETVRSTLTKREQTALMHERAGTRAGRQCIGASNLIQTSSTKLSLEPRASPVTYEMPRSEDHSKHY